MWTDLNRPMMKENQIIYFDRNDMLRMSLPKRETKKVSGLTW